LDLDLDLDFGAWTLVGLGLLARKPDFGKVRGRGIGLWFWTWTSCASLGDAQAPELPGSILAPENTITKVLMARSTALAHTGIDDKNTREAGWWLPSDACDVNGVYRRVWPKRGRCGPPSGSHGRIGNVGGQRS
jgi:hypothetical protein